MVACVSPSHSNCEHTLNTLRYADRVKEHVQGDEKGPVAHVGSSNYDALSYGGPSTNKAVAQQRPHTAGSELLPPPPPPLPMAAAQPVLSQQQQQRGGSSNNNGRAQTPPRGGRPTTASAVPSSSSNNSNVYQSPSQRDRAQKKEALLAAQKSPMGVALLEKERQARLAAAARKETDVAVHATPIHHFEEIQPPSRQGATKTPLVVAPTPLHLPDDEEEEEEEEENEDNDGADHNQEHLQQHEEEEEDEEDGDDDDDDMLDEEDALESTELIQKTVGLLSAHKLSIAEMVEVRWWLSFCMHGLFLCAVSVMSDCIPCLTCLCLCFVVPPLHHHR
jgi:hypothetical protein